MVDQRRVGCAAGAAEKAHGLCPPRGPADNLPLPLTGLIGRDRELAAVHDLVSRCRLVTVVGPGGVGKTRVALAVASASADTYRDGSLLVDLADVGDLPSLWARVAEAVGLTPSGGRLPQQRVLAHLRSRELLMLLDNCEHLTSECGAFAVSVTRACPDVSLLVTSRRALGVVGEQVWPLAGLGAESEDHQGHPSSTASAAVRLFVERAEAQGRDFALGPEGRAVVAEVCRGLDGLPLAIELAAARAGVLTPAEILARLDEPFVLLAGGNATVPARHRSLEATLRWSHDLLSPSESVMFRRLSVFEGSFTLDAAEAVCATSPPLTVDSALEVISSLVAASLVIGEAVGDQTRYRLLQSTHKYAARRLAEAGEAGLLRDRHAEWCLALVQEAERNARGHKPAPWLARMAAEQDNVEAALDWAVRAERTDWALGIAGAMAVFWRKWNRYSTGIDWLARALALPGQRPALRVAALLGQGLLLGEGGDGRGANGPLEEAFQLAEESGDVRAEARALNLLGYFRLFVDAPTTALPSLERSTARALAAGDRRTLLEALSGAGLVAMFGGDARVADARFRECLAMAEGDERLGIETWGALVGLGWAALAQGHSREAETRFLDALATADRIRARHAQAVAWAFLGQLARARGDYGRATALLTDALAQARETTHAFGVAVRLASLGGVAHDRGDLDAAEAALVEALSVVGSELPFAHAQCLVALGALRVTQGRSDEAAVLLDEGLAVSSGHGLRGVVASALLQQARLRRLADDLHEAARVATRAIDLLDRLGDRWGMVDALEALAGVRAGQGRGRTACRLFAAAESARREGHLVRPPVRAVDHESDVALARRGLDPGEWDALWAGAASLSPAGAAALAIQVQGRRDSASTGWDAITPTEREVVALVAQGLTNREAAARLVVSSRTVETHVAHVLAKVGIASRRELARVASAKGFG